MQKITIDNVLDNISKHMTHTIEFIDSVSVSNIDNLTDTFNLTLEYQQVAEELMNLYLVCNELNILDVVIQEIEEIEEEIELEIGDWKNE